MVKWTGQLGKLSGHDDSPNVDLTGRNGPDKWGNCLDIPDSPAFEFVQIKAKQNGGKIGQNMSCVQPVISVLLIFTEWTHLNIHPLKLTGS